MGAKKKNTEAVAVESKKPSWALWNSNAKTTSPTTQQQKGTSTTKSSKTVCKLHREDFPPNSLQKAPNAYLNSNWTCRACGKLVAAHSSNAPTKKKQDGPLSSMMGRQQVNTAQSKRRGRSKHRGTSTKRTSKRQSTKSTTTIPPAENENSANDTSNSTSFWEYVSTGVCCGLTSQQPTAATNKTSMVAVV